MAKKLEINKETNIAELVTNHPKAGVVLTDYGLHCAGCFLSKYDTIGNGAKVHGFSETETLEMIEDIKEAIQD